MVNISINSLKQYFTQQWIIMIGLLLSLIFFCGVIKITLSDIPVSSKHENKNMPLTFSRVTPHDISRLLSWNLFGPSYSSIFTDKFSAYEITGIVESNIPKATTVFLTTKGSKEKAYVIGDQLQGNDKLEQVFDDHIIISHNGTLHSIVFEQKDKGTSYINSNMANNTDADTTDSNDYTASGSSSDANSDASDTNTEVNTTAVRAISRMGRFNNRWRAN